MQIISGFSKLSIQEKIEVLRKNVPLDSRQVGLLNSSALSNNSEIYDAIRNLSENYISGYTLPFSIAPNFLINGKNYLVPMVTEESSVVAAASYAAKFWSDHGGFRAEIKSTKKSGQVYFTWDAKTDGLVSKMPQLKEKLIEAVSGLTANMEKRGGGITGITLYPEKNISNGVHILNVEFETADSMGANLINSCLEIMASELITFIRSNFNDSCEPEILMAILSNYTPECLVECAVECEISHLSSVSGSLTPDKFAGKFIKVVQIAQEDVYRAVTHNKGIFNGIDAVLIATGNDFRAVEASGHAYAARNGSYTSLTNAEINGNRFSFKLGMPMSIGTVGGATSVHPLAKLAIDILKNPSGPELMQIVAAAGLASNFAAIRSLITDGIQKGHMKLHLNNILIHFNATEAEKRTSEEYFSNKQISFSAVAGFLGVIRNKK